MGGMAWLVLWYRVRLIEHIHNGERIVIGGNYATNGKPKLEINELLDF